MDPTKCTFGIKMPIELKMLNAIISREVKNFRNYKIYRPNFAATPVTGKFYAAHDQLMEQTPEETQKIEDYMINVEKSRTAGPRTTYTLPVTENQTYGWYSAPLVHLDRSDGRLFHPMRESKDTKTEIMIKTSIPTKRN